MKSIEQITIVNINGEPMHDTAPDVLTRAEQDLLIEGKTLGRDAGPVMTTEYLLKRMIDLCVYPTRTQQKIADKIHDKIIVTDGKILMEDADYAVIMGLKDTFTPYLNGNLFSPFHEAIESAVTVDPASPKN